MDGIEMVEQRTLQNKISLTEDTSIAQDRSTPVSRSSSGKYEVIGNIERQDSDSIDTAVHGSQSTLDDIVKDADVSLKMTDACGHVSDLDKCNVGQKDGDNNRSHKGVDETNGGVSATSNSVTPTTTTNVLKDFTRRAVIQNELGDEKIIYQSVPRAIRLEPTDDLSGLNGSEGSGESSNGSDIFTTDIKMFKQNKMSEGQSKGKHCAKEEYFSTYLTPISLSKDTFTEEVCHVSDSAHKTVMTEDPLEVHKKTYRHHC